MNTLNRVLIVLGLIAAVFLCTAALVLPAAGVPVLESLAGQLERLAELVESLRWYVRIPLAVLFAATLDIVLVLFLILEVRRPRPKFIRVEKAAGGEVNVSMASISDRLNYEVNSLPNVLRVKSKVSSKRKGVVISLDADISAGMDVPMKADQIVERARQVVEEKMGLKMARPPKVNLRAIPYPEMLETALPTKPTLGVEPEEPEPIPAEERPGLEEDVFESAED